MAIDALDRVEKLLGIQSQYQDKMKAERTSGAAFQIIDRLFEIPLITAPIIQNLLGVSNQTAQGHIRRLANAGILAGSDSRAHPRIYLAPEILQVIQAAARFPRS